MRKLRKLCRPVSEMSSKIFADRTRRKDAKCKWSTSLDKIILLMRKIKFSWISNARLDRILFLIWILPSHNLIPLIFDEYQRFFEIIIPRGMQWFFNQNSAIFKEPNQRKIWRKKWCAAMMIECVGAARGILVECEYHFMVKLLLDYKMIIE